VTETGSSPGATPGEPQTFLRDPRADLHLCARAYAQAPDAEAAARQFLEEYRRAHENGDIDHLTALYVSFPEGQRKALTDYLKDITRLRVELVNVKVEPHGKDLAVSYTRRDNFIDKESGEPVTLEVRVTKFLVQAGGKWKFAEGG
jgi:hypothetical protein